MVKCACCGKSTSNWKTLWTIKYCLICFNKKTKEQKAFK